MAVITESSVRAEVRGWLANNWDRDLELVAWRSALVASGWGVPSWSKRWYGRGLPAWSDDVVRDELAAIGAPGLSSGVGAALAAPTILAHGPDSVRERFLPPVLSGAELWCQLFSEPGSGSDLAGLTTHAVLDGDEWVVNGQKVWNTSAHHADVGMLVARTNWDVPKHQGLTYFALPMHQPGVEVRPLRQMNDHASFNEVFLSNARIPRDHVIGDVGGGWRVTLTTLSFERVGARSQPTFLTGSGRAIEEANHEVAANFDTYKWYPQRYGRVDLIVDRAREAGRADDPVVRQEIARLLSMHWIRGWTIDRALAARSLGRSPGPEGSITKLALSMESRFASKVHAMISGADAMLAGADGARQGVIAEIFVSVPAQSIAGGTDEIQRNIVAEKHLGLPREPASNRELPFREVLRNR